MAEPELRVGDVGTKIQVTIQENLVALDISAATTKEILFRRPDRTVFAKAATFVATGADGQIEYVTVSADLDQVGTWRIQGHIVLPAGEWWSETKPIEVGESYQPTV